MIPDQLSYETQMVGESEERPDLVGRTEDGEALLLIEAKFWAGLTEHQPITYLQSLPPGGALLFVVPETRLPSIWNELLVRCGQAKLAVTSHEVSGSGMRAVDLDGGKSLALTSWRRLLEDLHHATRDADEPLLAQDIVQLQGLCDQMDEDAFLPIRNDELTSKHYRRILEFANLPEDAVGILVNKQRADKGTLRQGSGLGFRGTYFWLHGAAVFLAFDLRHWLKHGMTPIWLTVYGESASTKTNKNAAWAALESLRNASPPMLFEDDQYGLPIVPILLPVGVERDRVLSCIVEQADRIGPLIAHLGMKRNVESASDSDQPEAAVREP